MTSVKVPPRSIQKSQLPSVCMAVRLPICWPLYRGACARGEASHPPWRLALTRPRDGRGFLRVLTSQCRCNLRYDGAGGSLRTPLSGPVGHAKATILRVRSGARACARPACAQAQWRLPSAYPADNFHSEHLAAFAKDVGDVTGGQLAIRVYPNASLFPATAIKSAVRIGQAQAGEILISLHDNEDPMFGIDVVPFLAASYDEARKLWAASKPVIE